MKKLSNIIGICFLIMPLAAIIILFLSGLGFEHIKTVGDSFSSTTKKYSLWKWYFPDSSPIFIGLIAIAGVLLIRQDNTK